MNTIQPENGERLSFFQLFAEKNIGVEIPIIQRDYAQGRTNKREVRTKFLDALHQYLSENRPARDLDFVYGNLVTSEGELKLIPLDGQQRLTTLFLLHWYLALSTNRMDDLCKHMVRGTTSRFGYETRASAREFCNALMVEDMRLDQKDSSISEHLTNQGWYFLSWRYDPTIQAMLVMLDAIEVKFKDNPEFLDRLLDLESPVITFLFLNLHEFQLSDDLYIKMNSRGKALTPFENFKAKLGQYIHDNFSESETTFNLTLGITTREVKAHEYFANMIDTAWLNHFWKAGNKKPEKIDEYLINYIQIILANNYALSQSRDGNNLRTLVESQDAKKDDEGLKKHSFFAYQELGALSEDSVMTLINSFDQVIRSFQIVPEQKPNTFHYDDGATFNRVMQHDITRQERILFHAFTSYLIHYPQDLTGLADWMRVAYNLIENTQLRDVDDLSKGLQEIDKLIPKASVILDFLTSTDSNIGFYTRIQVEEERLKALLIHKGDIWSNLIRTTEEHSFFKGQIGFLLEFSGIWEFYQENAHVDWGDELDTSFHDSFVNYSNKARCVFDAYLKGDNTDYIWERAVLCKGDYLIPASYHRYHLLTENLTDRDYSWKRLLRLNRSGDREDLNQRRQYVKAIFDDKRFNPGDFKTSCLNILKDVPEDWRSYFVNEPQLIGACERGFIRYENDLNIKLLRTTKLTYHYELMTYDLHLEHINGDEHPPFKHVNYYLGYGHDAVCSIHFGAWVYNRKSYEMRILFTPEDKFILLFLKSKGDKSEENYDVEIRSILSDMTFKYVDNDIEGFCLTKENKIDIASDVYLLCAKLKDLSSQP